MFLKHSSDRSIPQSSFGKNDSKFKASIHLKVRDSITFITQEIGVLKG